MLVGLLIPLLIAFVTKARLGQPWKALIVLFFSTVAGVIASQVGPVPASLSGWGHVMLSVIMTYLAAAVSYMATWKPTGVSTKINEATADFGIG